jgi:hypothetical protein
VARSDPSKFALHQACQAMAVVGIVLQEIAEAIDVEWRGEGDDAC